MEYVVIKTKYNSRVQVSEPRPLP